MTKVKKVKSPPVPISVSITLGHTSAKCSESYSTRSSAYSTSILHSLNTKHPARRQYGTGKKKRLSYLVGNLVATNWPIEKALHAIGYNQIPTK